MVDAKKIKSSESNAGHRGGVSHNVSLKDGKVQIKRDSVEIKPADVKFSVERAMTGIGGVDKVMGGGFERDSVNIVCGGPGTGKSIFALQFLVNGAEKYGEPGVYITFEETKDKIIKHMAEFGWDLKKLESSNKLIIIEYTPEHVKKLLAEGGGEVDLAVEKIGAKRIVIDSLTAFALLFKDDLARMEAFLDLFKLVHRWGCTALLVSEDEQDIEMHHPNNVEFEVDGVILLYNIRKGDVRERALEVLKMRGIGHSNKIFPMKITGRGVVVFPEETVF
jgi:circadian clock protein KaiC